jgi:hypothetical protein
MKVCKGINWTLNILNRWWTTHKKKYIFVFKLLKMIGFEQIKRKLFKNFLLTNNDHAAKYSTKKVFNTNKHWDNNIFLYIF